MPQPFGTDLSSNANLDVIKIFGCSVVDFNVSADWSSQGGSLQMRLIEDDTAGDKFIAPVLGSPALFQLTSNNYTNVLFQYIGLVDSISRSSSNSKTYSVSLSSPLKILDSAQVILDGWAGFGGSQEGTANFTGIEKVSFGHRNNAIINWIPYGSSDRTNHWANVSNLINVFAVWENDDLLYRSKLGNYYGGYGFSSNSQDGMPLQKVLWAMHYAINHITPRNLTTVGNEGMHGGNLLYGRHNYNTSIEPDSIPFYYHVDILNFYNQISPYITANFRLTGPNKTINEIITEICNEANLEFYTYIDLNVNGVGNSTLQEEDLLYGSPASCSWPGLTQTKFNIGGRYGGTIRIQTVSKNQFYNSNRPFSDVAYNLIGLEVPDRLEYASSNNIHPGKRPINDSSFGISSNTTVYSDPLDSSFTDVGTSTAANGGTFPVDSSNYNNDYNSLMLARPTNVELSLKSNDHTTVKVLTGGPITRLVTVPRQLIRHYWGEILVPNVMDPEVDNTETDPIGLSKESTKLVPIITQQLDPRDMTDYILIDMKSDFGPLSVTGVFHHGIYAASMLEIRTAMAGENNWNAYMDGYKKCKLKRLTDYHFPSGCIVDPSGSSGVTRKEMQDSTTLLNASGGLGYVGASQWLGLGNTFALYETAADIFNTTVDESGDPPYIASSSTGLADMCSGLFGLNIKWTTWMAEHEIKKQYYPTIWENIKTIGDAHYGKSWVAPVPALSIKEDLDGTQIVGNFEYSWDLTDSAYVEPAYYRSLKVPQSSKFVSDGKVSPFVNWNNNFVYATGSGLDQNYQDEIVGLSGRTRHVLNFSEYTADDLCVTSYRDEQIIHASPNNISSKYMFLPAIYDVLYSRAKLPYHSIRWGISLFYANIKNESEKDMLLKAGQELTDKVIDGVDYLATYIPGVEAGDFKNLVKGWTSNPDDKPKDEGADERQINEASGYFDRYIKSLGIPCETNNNWLIDTVNGLESIDIYDNGRFSFPFVKFETARVFLPQPAPGMTRNNNFGDFPVRDGFNAYLNNELKFRRDEPVGEEEKEKPQNPVLNHIMTLDSLASILTPFKTCVAPYSFSYPQISNRHVYGPWITDWNYVAFRGKVEYEQDDSLVPENFLIPINYGNYGSYSMTQTSGLDGMDLVAQSRVNSIDNYNAFAIEEGSITIPGGPSIKRIGDILYGLPRVTDLKVSISADKIETSYSFKTVMPKFGKNNRDIEKKINKISNLVKQRKME